MTDTNDLPAVASDSFNATAGRQAQSLVLTLTGTADLQSQSSLEEFLIRINQVALGGSATEVVVDLRHLESMSSPCFKAFVSWIEQLREIEHARQYRIRFLSDARLLWQRRSLHALSCLAVDLITVETS